MSDVPAMDVGGRAQRLIDAIGASAQRAFLVTKPVNVRWLSGFTGSNGALVVSPNEPLRLFTDGRYEEQAQLETAAAGVEVELTISRANDADIAAYLCALGVEACSVESHHLSVDRSNQFAAAAPSVVFEPAGPVIDALRRPKDVGEIARLRRAADIADRALAQHEAAITAGGMTERAFALSLESAMFDLGADGLSFDTIVASGPNSTRPHARPSQRVLTPGDLVVIDFGASVDGYGSDMTRTLAVGADPTDDQQALYAAVEEAQAAGVAAVRAGVEQVTIDAACRSVLARHGLAEAFIHGTGHGIGLEIHEQPILSARSVGILPADLVVTVEPGAYVADRGGVRVEDSVVVTTDGCDPITHFPKGLVPWLSLPMT